MLCGGISTILPNSKKFSTVQNPKPPSSKKLTTRDFTEREAACEAHLAELRGLQESFKALKSRVAVLMEEAKEPVMRKELGDFLDDLIQFSLNQEDKIAERRIGEITYPFMLKVFAKSMISLEPEEDAKTA